MDKVITRALFLTLLTTISTGLLWKNSTSKPTFEEESENEVWVNIGRTAFLPCRVKDIGDRVVLWIRTSDLLILTYGDATFTRDNRFESSHPKLSKPSTNWGLRIRNVQISDTGTYECQVNTDPKISRKVVLQVDSDLNDSPFNTIDSHVIADTAFDIMNSGQKTKIFGPDEQFVQIGSTVTLTCLVVSTGSKLGFLEWLKNGKLVSFQAPRGGISIHTDRSDQRITSSLTIADVKIDDSANYSCRPQHGHSHSISLHVIEEERTEAMRRIRNGGVKLGPSFKLFIPSSLILIFPKFYFSC